MCLTGIERTSPAAQARVKGVSALTTSTSTCRQTNRRPALGSSAPGSSPASQSTWKPLQIPSTGPPPRAYSLTDSITGEKRAMAPAAQVVAVGEAAGDHDGVDAVQIAVAMPEQLCVGEPAAGEQRVDFVAGAREPDDSESHSTTSTS